MNLLLFLDDVSLSSSQEIEYDEENDDVSINIAETLPRSRSLTNPRGIRSNNLEESEIQVTLDQLTIGSNMHTDRQGNAATANRDLELKPIEPQPYDLDSSFTSDSKRGCGKLSSCVIT